MPLLLLVSAFAADLTHRELLHDALLKQSLDGDLQGSVVVLQRLVQDTAADDPIRGEAFYWLGKGRWELGQVDTARQALIQGVRSGTCGPRCRDLLEQLELDLQSVTEVPLHWSFEQPDHGVFHPWRYQERGSIRLDGPTGALVWSTVPDPRNPDRLEIAFSLQTSPTTVAWHLNARQHNATIQVIAADIYGDRYTSQPVALTQNTPAEVKLTLQTMRPIDDTHPLNPQELSRVWLVDITRGAQRHEILLSDFTVR